jgi:hypothetical protein
MAHVSISRKLTMLRREFRATGITIPHWLVPRKSTGCTIRAFNARATCQRRYYARKRALAQGAEPPEWCRLQPRIYPGRPITSTHPRAAYWRAWKRKRAEALRSGNHDLIRRDP